MVKHNNDGIDDKRFPGAAARSGQLGSCNQPRQTQGGRKYGPRRGRDNLVPVISLGKRRVGENMVLNVKFVEKQNTLFLS